MPASTTKYKKEFDEQAYKLCLLGHKDTELASYFEVKESTINNWKKSHPTFLESLRDGKENADSEVVRALYKRATGYEAKPEVKVETSQIDSEDGEGEKTEGAQTLIKTTTITKHVGPDTAAGIFWLKNRQSGKWRDKQDINHSGEIIYNCDYGPKESKT